MKKVEKLNKNGIYNFDLSIVLQGEKAQKMRLSTVISVVFLKF